MNLPAIILSVALSVPAALAQTAPPPWSEPLGVPAQVGPGGGIVATAADTVYVLCGDNNGSSTAATDLFYRYTISTQTWTPQAKVPGSVGAGGAITFMPGTNHVYVLRGGGSAEFYRFDVATGQWTLPAALAPLPFLPGDGAALAATTSKVYALRGGGTDAFYEYTPDAGAGTWAPLANTSNQGGGGPIGAGFALIHGGGASDYLYVNGPTRLWRYSIHDRTWDFGSLAFHYGLAGGLALDPANPDLIYARMDDRQIIRFKVSTNTWELDAPADAIMLPAPSEYTVYVSTAGGGLAMPAGSDLVYVLRGGTSHLWRVDPRRDANGVVKGFVSSFPRSPDEASLLVGVGDGERLYSISINDSKEFYSYSISNKAWTPMADLPVSTMSKVQSTTTTGTKLAYDGAGYIYAVGINRFFPQTIPGGFFRYSVDGDRWEELPESLQTWLASTAGGSGIVGAGGSLYVAVQGTTYGSFYSFDGTWHKKSAPPTPFFRGFSLVYPGSGDLLYAFRGGQGIDPVTHLVIPTPDFWCYSISHDAWNVREDGSAFDPANCPSNIGGGSSLCYSGRGAMLYAFSGNLKDEPLSAGRFWAYSTTGDRWIEGTRAPASLSGGAGLASPGPGRYLFALSGMTELWRYEKENFPPNPPSAMAQFRPNGKAIDSRGITVEAQVTLCARIDDDDAEESTDKVWLEVEVKPASIPFNGLQTLFSEHVATATTVSVVATLPTINTYYHWRARAVDSRGGKGDWSDFGGNDAWDIWYRDNAAPVVTVAATQLRAWNGVPIEPGERVLDEGGVTFQVTTTDSHNDPVAIEVRLTTVGGWGDSTVILGVLSSGGVSSVTLQPASGDYCWESRAMDEWDAASPWTSFRGASPAEIDFTLLPFGSQGGLACHGSSGGGPAWALAIVLAAGFLPLLFRRFPG